jgi:secreted trypsin-like serine protease
MRRYFLATAALALVLATPATADYHASIVGGSPAAQGKYPAQGLLYIDDDGDGFVDGQCGGTLVAARYFLTAAHCATDLTTGAPFPPGAFAVGLGNVDSEAITDFYGVAAVDVNSGWNPGTFQNDTTMLKLGAPAPYTPMRVLDTGEAAKWAAGTTATVIGWGRIDDGQPASRFLLEAQVPIIDDAACGAFEPGFDANTMVCAYDGTHDTCQGDSGGPLLVPDAGGFALAGVTSWGIGCADMNHPGVYARVGAPALNAWVKARIPRASFTVGAANSRHPTTFTSTSVHPPPATYASYLWDFDADGQFDDGSGQTVTRTFPTQGSYPVRLAAITPEGDSIVAQQTVAVNGTPTAVSRSYVVREGGSVTLAGSGADPEGGAVTYSWDRDNNGSFETAGRSFRFSAARIDGPARRTVRLRVCDTANACQVAASTVRVLNVKPRARAGKDRRTRVGARVRFTGVATDPGRDRLRYSWRFGDGKTAKGKRATHRFKRPGRYRVVLTVTDGDKGVGRDTLIVRVRR